MHHEVLNIRVVYARAELSGSANPQLYTYIHEATPELTRPPRPAVVICPGGAYQFTSDREAEPVAARFFAMGYQCFVLRYTVKGSVPFPAPQLELAEAVALIRRHADQWQVDAEKIAVCGFSAGGHLAASLGVFWNRDFIREPLGLTDECRPNALILGYPVISSGAFAHSLSIHNLLGSHYDTCVELVSLDKQVSQDTPPTFIWHTWDDANVPVENSLLFISALRKAGVPTEAHIFPHGPHGLSLATEETGLVQEECRDWPDWAGRWLRSLGSDLKQPRT